MKIKHYKTGDKEDGMWTGDIVSHCEFLQYLPFGIMVFREISPSPCVRAAYYEVDNEGILLNGWEAFKDIKTLKKRVSEEMGN